MIRFHENYSLKEYNTFHIEAAARYFFEFTEPEDLLVFLRSNQTWKGMPLLVIGEGSNILLTDNFEGLVLRPNIPGIKEIKEDRRHIRIEAGAGEIWDDLVKYTVDRQLGGIENLSLIPGTVGAAPVQNIGAFGQEVSDVIASVKGIDLEKHELLELPADSCSFGYRDSCFKKNLKNRFIITSVLFRMEKFPEYRLEYGQLEKEVKATGEVTLQNIRDTIIRIRTDRLPDLALQGSAGSFFKNPVVDPVTATRILAKHKDAPIYPSEDGRTKLAAGWLIEKAGWKGYREGDAAVHEKQALVLVNRGHATGKEILELSEKIRQSVWNMFGVQLEPEVNII